MNTHSKGLFITIEGIDGSGKTTQFRLLAERLAQKGYSVTTFNFPRYSEPSSYFVREYLKGNYGSAEQLGPYTSSLFFALDRFQAATHIRQALDKGDIVLVDRFTGSNMAHQGTHFKHPEERRGYYIWLDNLEYEMLKIPRPNLNLVMQVPADVAGKHTKAREAADTNQKRDILEADDSHQTRAETVYQELCQLFPKDYLGVQCAQNGELMPVATTSNRLWSVIEPLLPPIAPDAKPQSVKAEKIVNPFITKQADGSYAITATGQQFLSEAVTNTTGNVYAFTDKLNTVTVAAAMARLSRRADDMRITLLDEFAMGGAKDEALLKRVITGYGDDSVQQLAGMHVVVENASNILTKKLEWGRLAAYLEQSTRYIYFDQKDAKGHYRFHIPSTLNKAVRAHYIKSMNALFDQYSALVHSMADYLTKHSNTPEDERDGAWRSAIRAQACDAIRPVLPVATTATVGIYASGQALESLIMHLLSDELQEARTVGKQMLDECRKVMPTFLERADKPERGGAMQAYRANTFKTMASYANKLLPQNLSSETQPVTLTEYWPKNELDVVADMLYEHSNLPLESIQAEVATWPYDQKAEVFSAYMGERLNRRMRPGRALEKIHYSWDLVCDYGIFRDLQRHRMVDDLAWQQLTPRYGYEVPQLVQKAGLADQFEACFDASLQLFSYLQSHDYALEAQYATLLGHKMRWKITYNARQAFHLHELRTTPQGHPGYRKLMKQIHDELASVHPLVAESMQFVNRDEDPELTRLAAERYSQYKLKLLESKQ